MASVSTHTLMRSPAADRNKDAILNVLKDVVPNGHVKALEIASGTGQHVVHFAQTLTDVTWQPSECDEKSIQSICGYISTTSCKNVESPIFIDTTTPANQWASGALDTASFDLVLCINMIHIAPWQATEGLFAGAGLYLKQDGLLVTYGPYSIDGDIQPNSNVQYDSMLRHQHPDWGLRDTNDLKSLADQNGMVLDQKINMPTNNYTLVFRKK